MTERSPIRPIHPTEPVPEGRTVGCGEWEALLADAIDGTLAAIDTAAFNAHSESCRACAAALEDTRKGQQWLQFLHAEPAVPGDLLTRILAQTSGAGVLNPAGMALPTDGLGISAPAPPLPSLWKRAPRLATSVPALWLRRTGDTRVMMTAAMAFFSIALTLNLMGVRLSSVRLADLRPNALQMNIRRSYISANARVSRYYDNLRIVYEVESRMREMQRTSEEEQPLERIPPAQHQENRKNPDGSAGKTSAPAGKSQSPRNDAPRAYGQSELAAGCGKRCFLDVDSRERSWA